MRFFNDWNTRRRRRTTGQALILIVLTFMGLLLFLGLMVDLGQIFLAKGYLRRAADAAALAAAGQFREGRTFDEMRAAAHEISLINGIDPTTIRVQTCKGGDGGADTTLCPNPGDIPKKLVRVTIDLDYPLTFLALLDIYSVHLTESSVSESASMDVVLVIDVGESMSWDKNPDIDLDYTVDPANPAVCNLTNTCEPFKFVKAAAADFASKILDKSPADEEDRLAIVTFANGWQAGDLGTQVKLQWTNSLSDALHPVYGIPSLKVYDPGVICPFDEWGCPGGLACPATDEDIPVSACAYIAKADTTRGGIHQYRQNSCARTYDTTMPSGPDFPAQPEAISACTSTNIGGALNLAGKQFEVEKRPDALWVVILLTDGAANATFGNKTEIGQTGSGATDFIFPPQDPDDFLPNLPYGFCPPGTYDFGSNLQYCQDDNVDVHHSLPSSDYDADDFARDQGKFVACYANNPSASCNGVKGQGAVIFTIGLGNEILRMDNDGTGPKPYGASLLRYLAAIGDDGDADPVTSDLCKDENIAGRYNTNCGNYFFAQAGVNLVKVFEMIYSRIFTRLTV